MAGSSSEVLVTSADSRTRVVDGVDLVHKFKGTKILSYKPLFFLLITQELGNNLIVRGSKFLGLSSSKVFLANFGFQDFATRIAKSRPHLHQTGNI